MPEKLIEELKKLMADWNKLGDLYYKQHKEDPNRAIREICYARSQSYYSCAERLREKLIKCGIDLEE